MLKPEPKHRPNVEDLLNLPNVSIRLRERALKRNIEHMKKKNEEIELREQDMNKQERELQEREDALNEKESEIE
jgi:NIMA (never in mitosis gene a)-related kinase 2